jgi:hypothetical protein
MSWTAEGDYDVQMHDDGKNNKSCWLILRPETIL